MKNIIYKLIASIFLISILYSFSFYKSETSIAIIERKIIVKTDKITYNKSKAIKIIFNNNLNDSVYSHIGSHTPIFAIKQVEKKVTKNNWVQYFAYCQFPNCILDTDIPVIIRPKQTIIMEWLPILYSNGDKNGKIAEEGTYKILILYLNSDKSEWQEIYSNEFIIK